MSMTNEQIIENLHNNICTVVFEKADGSKRTMRCTLNATLAPSMPQEIQESSNRAKNPNACPVWDVDLNEWRSFRFDSVESFNGAQVLMG